MSRPQLRRPFWRRFLLPAVLLLFAVNTVTLVSYTLPRLYRERRVAARVDMLREEVSRLTSRFDALTRVSTTLRLNTEDEEKFFASMVGTRTERLVPTVLAIESAAREEQLRLGQKSFDIREIKALSLRRFAIVMPISGSYQQLTGFLGRLEAAKEFLTVDAVSLNEKPGGADLRVSVSAYFKPEDEGSRGK